MILPEHELIDFTSNYDICKFALNFKVDSPASDDEITKNRLQIRNLRTLKYRAPCRKILVLDFFDMKDAKNHVPAINPGDPPDFPLRGG